MVLLRYKLEPYKGINSRYNCPSCACRRTFSRYLDMETGLHLDSTVGRCNREIKCGYHLTPKQYFEQSGQTNQVSGRSEFSKAKAQIVTKEPGSSIIPIGLFNESIESSQPNNLKIYLLGLFGPKLATALATRYLLGSSTHWKGATVFWQVDTSGAIRTGKIILYNPNTGKRVKEPFIHINWVHSVLKIEGYKLNQCLFGEHLLTRNDNRPAAIVESEKTAIIASAFLPQFIWLATGSLSNLNAEKLKAARDRNILLFPDLLCYDRWREKAKQIEFSLRKKIIVSDFLEKNASLTEKEQGLDIADFLIKKDEIFGWALTDFNYPHFWDYKQNL